MVGEFIRNRRVELRMSQGSLADALEMAQPQLSRLERGEVGLPQRATLEKLARALRVPLSELYRAAGVLEGVDEDAPAPPPGGTDDDAIVADLFEQFRAIAPPEALDVLRQMKENETPEVYRQALAVLVEAFAANARMGTRMMHLRGE